MIACMVVPLDANAQLKKDKEATQVLQDENTALKRQVDSLNAMLAKARQQNQKHKETIAKLKEEAEKKQEAPKPAVFNLGPDAKDSISIWYAQDCMKNIKEENINLDSVKLTSSTPTDIYLERVKNMNNIFTLPYNEIVQNNVIMYAEKRKSWIPTTLGLCSYYFPMFQETFNKYGIPEELAALAIVETNLNPVAVSRVGARGMWQFMYAAAKAYGLKIDSYVDERLDVVKATDAAARYLLDAYKRFGDWSLAISSYNCGSGNVNRAIIRNGGSTDYWGIYQYLPKETRGYVPAFVGALYITKYYKEHGMNPKPCMLPEKVDTFMINKKVHFVQLRDVVGVPLDELRRLNPQYVHDIIPGNDQPYVLRMPEEYAEKYIQYEDSLYKYKTDSLFNPVVIKQIESSSAMYSGNSKIAYKVKSGDTLSKIASKYHVSVNDLKRWNNLKSTNIRVNQTLYIYKGGVVTKPTTTAAPTTTTKPAVSTAPVTKPVEQKPVEAKPEEKPEVVETPESVDTDEAETTAAEEDEEFDDEEEEIREITQHPGLDKVTVDTTKSEPAPAKEEAKPEYVEYVVKKGDTMYSISKQFTGVTADEIMKYNKTTTDIHPGDVLRIPVK